MIVFFTCLLWGEKVNKKKVLQQDNKSLTFGITSHSFSKKRSSRSESSWTFSGQRRNMFQGFRIYNVNAWKICYQSVHIPLYLKCDLDMMARWKIPAKDNENSKSVWKHSLILEKSKYFDAPSSRCLIISSRLKWLFLVKIHTMDQIRLMVSTWYCIHIFTFLDETFMLSLWGKGNHSYEASPLNLFNK